MTLRYPEVCCISNARHILISLPFPRHLHGTKKMRSHHTSISLQGYTPVENVQLNFRCYWRNFPHKWVHHFLSHYQYVVWSTIDIIAKIGLGVVRPSFIILSTPVLIWFHFLFRLCFLHNQVNERLKKPEFDCAHLDETYDCGCGDAPIGNLTTSINEPLPDLERDSSVDDITGAGLIKGGR